MCFFYYNKKNFSPTNRIKLVFALNLGMNTHKLIKLNTAL